jgi:hypothetical protein
VVTESPHLVSTLRTLPESGNEIKVQYWIGTYERSEKLGHTFRLIKSDCQGDIILDTTYETEEDVLRSFSMHNPNLENVAQHSWELAPMSDQQAAAEFAATKNRCEQ